MRVQKSFAARVILLALSAACMVGAARAQESPVLDKEQQPEAQPTKPEMVTPPLKRNARPAAEAAAKPEPFDKATAEQMSKQCVTLATDEGPIEIEMLAEAAPESVRNFLNLSASGAYDTTVFSR